MLDRESCERRVYRLATLLTGNPIAATRVISQVVGSQPDLTKLDGAHMDRLTVLRSREISSATLAAANVSHIGAKALAHLTPQQREAWVFGRVYSLPLREMARAMDCSSTAAERHLLQADVAVRDFTGSNPSAIADQLLKFSLTLDVPEFFRRTQRTRRQIRLGVIWTAIILLALVIAYLVVWWTRPLESDSKPTTAPMNRSHLPGHGGN